MKLPRGAFSPKETPGVVFEVRAVADRVRVGIWEQPGPAVEGHQPHPVWFVVDIKRQTGRKLIRRLIAAIDRAEAYEHAAGIVRRTR